MNLFVGVGWGGFVVVGFVFVNLVIVGFVVVDVVWRSLEKLNNKF